MTRKICLLMLSLSFSLYMLAQTIERGPYTVYLLAKDVYRIEEANSTNPAGIQTDKDGKRVRMNNCSDMYLIVGKKKALLIDLANFVKWDNTAIESLQSIVNERIGKNKLFITVTHNHGDHLGMLPAFKDDPNTRFWIPEAEFTGMDIFPKDRTITFSKHGSMDLGGGYVITTTEIPGHTPHSTIFFLNNKDLAFSGDGLGSGSGVWLFGNDNFITYTMGIENLIKYLEDPANKISREKLVIYGGHYWQRGTQEKLTAQIVYDMQTLIENLKKGTAESTAMSSPMKYLDTNFKYGTATITWNKEDADKYAKKFHTK